MATQADPAQSPSPRQIFTKVKPLFTLAIVLGANKLKLEEKLGLDLIRTGYISSQVVVMMTIAIIYVRVNNTRDRSIVKVPAEITMGQETKPAADMTVSEYDNSKVAELFKSTLMSAAILAFIHYKWGSTMPLILQGIMTPLNLLDSPLLLVHVFGLEAKDDLSRPWKKQDPMAMMSGMGDMGDTSTETQQVEQKKRVEVTETQKIEVVKNFFGDVSPDKVGKVKELVQKKKEESGGEWFPKMCDSLSKKYDGRDPREFMIETFHKLKDDGKFTVKDLVTKKKEKHGNAWFEHACADLQKLYSGEDPCFTGLHNQ